MCLQLHLRVESSHEIVQVATIFLQHPPAVHLNKRKMLCARGAEQVMGRMWGSSMASVHKLPCLHKNIVGGFKTTVTSMLRSKKGCECATKSCTKPNITVKQTHPIWSAEIRAHAPASASRRRSKKLVALPIVLHTGIVCAPNQTIQFKITYQLHGEILSHAVQRQRGDNTCRMKA
jgi:hypothetical protein